MTSFCVGVRYVFVGKGCGVRRVVVLGGGIGVRVVCVGWLSGVDVFLFGEEQT